jgi:hypothetical protein
MDNYRVGSLRNNDPTARGILIFTRSVETLSYIDMNNKALKERPAVKDSQGNICRVRKIWDDGGKTCDRYSVTFEI